MTTPTPTRPPARYVVIAHEGVWKINLDNRYYGPFATQEAALATARETAQDAAAQGHAAQVLLMEASGAFTVAWDSAAAQA